MESFEGIGFHESICLPHRFGHGLQAAMLRRHPWTRSRLLAVKISRQPRREEDPTANNDGAVVQPYERHSPGSCSHSGRYGRDESHAVVSVLIEGTRLIP
jgi:hypothetical protein